MIKKGIKNYWNTPDPERLWKFIKIPIDLNACWNWIGGKTIDGYGHFKYNGKVYIAHRFVYEYLMGKSCKKGKVTDHKCRNRGCVNPFHLRFVTIKENIQCGINFQSNKIECKHGHPFDEINTFIYKTGDRKGRRYCRKCGAISEARIRKKQKVAMLNV